MSGAEDDDLVVGLPWERLTQWRATLKGTVSAKTATLAPTTASSMSR